MQNPRSTSRTAKSTRALKTPRARKQEVEELLVPSQGTIDKNVKDGTFFRVRGKKSVKNNLSIGGAKNRFKSDPTFIYLPAGLNLAGSEGDVIAVLEKLVPEGEIDEVLQQAITAENYNVPVSQGGKKEIFDALVRDYGLKQRGEVERRQEGISASGKPIVTLGMLDYIISNLDTAVESAPSKGTATPKGPSRTKSAKSTRTAAPSSRVKTLSSKIASLAQGKVLNVSKMDANGVGARVINVPGPTSTIVGVDLEEIPIVSSTEEGYANALDVLSRETNRDYTPLIEDWREAKENVAPRSNRPVSLATASSRSKGKKLASPRRTRTLPNLNESTPPTSPPGVRKLAAMAATRTFGSRVTSPPTSPTARRSPLAQRIVEEEAEERAPVRRSPSPPRRSPSPVRTSPLQETTRQLTPPRENITTSPTVARGVGTGRKLKLGGLKLGGRSILNPAAAATEEF
ncbi:Hypothetical protein BQ3484_566 [Cedratvirus A11]|uniref:Uncharacterized protein n=1 Tax=Cedratvirus A11 TaxID=1903266 RepID=A0A1M7XVA1_9VIRU|nr:Hypothetical protein BQ3484_566 [Cedratvirus A11]SHO33634.1 Hypothetical protein BQ3484_566 [Cedratvirus A11]